MNLTPYTTIKGNNNNTYIEIHDPSAEYMKCKNSAIYFVEKYVRFVSPLELSENPVVLYQHQKDILRTIETTPGRIFISKHRQQGVSSILAAFAVWEFLFKLNHDSIVTYNTRSNGERMMNMIRNIYSSLPDWMKCDYKSWDKLGHRYDAYNPTNGNYIYLRSMNDLCGYKVDTVIVDETGGAFDHINNSFVDIVTNGFKNKDTNKAIFTTTI